MAKEPKAALKELPEEPKEAPKAKAPAKKARVIPALPKCVSFTVWASMNGVKDSHRAGMLAFLKNPNQPRPLSVWDSLFKDY